MKITYTVDLHCIDKYAPQTRRYLEAHLDQISRHIAGATAEYSYAESGLQQSGGEQPKGDEVAASGKAGEGQSGDEAKARVSKRGPTRKKSAKG